MKKTYSPCMEILLDMLNAKSRILDIGGGRDGFSFLLAADGHELTLFEDSGESIAEAWRKSEELGVRFKNMFFADGGRMLWRIKGEYDCVFMICKDKDSGCAERYSCAFEAGVELTAKNGIIFAEIPLDKRKECEAFEKVISENETLYIDDYYYIGRKV